MALPSFRGAPVRVQVPATSANLGPGFDAFGLALGLHNVVAARVVDSGLHVDVAGEGADSLRRDRRNLVVKAMRATFDVLGGQPRGLEVICANHIPAGRGLGSSAAAIVAGICAARATVLGGLPDDDALRIATELEGHPDNVAAALYGGATLAWTDATGAHAVRLPVSAAVHPVAFLPGSGKQSTRAARALLPEAVPHGDAVHTANRAALLVHALERRPDLLLAATEDWLHQPYRLAAQPRGLALVERLRAAGIAATLSGSGPTVLALATSAEQATTAAGLAGRGWTASPLEVDTAGAVELDAR
jgi:homoserine kinase